MDCSTYRESLSARLDNEPAPLDQASVDAHLASCSACQTWWQQSTQLNRAIRVSEAPQVPDLSAAIIAATPVPNPRRRAARVALATVALAQAGLGLVQLFGVQLFGSDGGHAAHHGATHLGNESAAWNLAVGIGLLWAALRPKSSAGLLPVLTGFVLVLGAISTADLFGGHVTVARLATHGILLAGLCLLFVVYRQTRATNDPGPLLWRTMPSPALDGPAATAPELPRQPARPHQQRRSGRAKAA